MTTRLTCPQGHTWQIDEWATTAAGQPTPACPTCGAAALARPTEPRGLAPAPSLTLPLAPAERPAVAEARADAEPATPATVAESQPAPPHGAPEGDTATLLLQPAVPGYEDLRELGRGGMGVVYKARQVGLGRVVALKMILAGGHAGPGERDRFRAEAQAMARLHHSNIVQVHEVGEHQGLPFFSLEYCPGGSLAQKLAATPLPPAEAAGLVETLARAMYAAHQKGILHRDLKPGNVLLAEDGTPKITDFGLVKHLDEAGRTASGLVMGTPGYMPPEQAAGRTKEIGPACDIYSLGAILYECLTGRAPFKSATPVETLRQVLHVEPVPPRQLNPQVPRDLETICLKCLQKDPARRYYSAEALADDLRRFRRGEAIVARPVGRLERAGKWVRRNPALAGAIAGVLIAMTAGTAVSAYFAFEAAAEAAAAQNNEAVAVAAQGRLEKANHELQESHDELERTLARSLLRPLGVQGDGAPLTDAEVEALWELAAVPGEGLGYRFIQEAIQGPVTTRQLTTRAPIALHAAVGISPKERTEAERMILARFQSAGISTAHRADLALLLGALGDPPPPVARAAAIALVRAIGETLDSLAAQRLAEGLVAVTSRLPADEAAARLAQAMGQTTDSMALPYLAQELLNAAAGLPPDEAARYAGQAAERLAAAMATTIDPPRLDELAQGLAGVCAAVPPDEAARHADRAATILIEVMRRPNGARVYHGFLENSLLTVCAWLPPERAAAVLRQAMGATADRFGLGPLARGLGSAYSRLPAETAVERLRAAMEQAADPYVLGTLAEGLAVVCGRMPPEEATRHATDAVRRLRQALPRSGDTVGRRALAKGLAAVCARLPNGAGATALLDALGATADPDALEQLARGLAAVAARLPPEEAARHCDAAAARLMDVLAKTADAYGMERLAGGLADLCQRLPADDAAARLARATGMLDDSYALGVLAEGVAPVAGRLPAGAGAPLAVTTADALVRAMGRTTDPAALAPLGRGLAALGPRLPADDAARRSAEAVGLLMRAGGTGGPERPDSAEAVQQIAPALAALSAWLPPERAAAVLTTAMERTSDHLALTTLARGLAGVATRLPPERAVAVYGWAMERAARTAHLPGHAGPTMRARFAAILTRLPPSQIKARTDAAAASVGLAAMPDPMLLPPPPLWHAAAPLPPPLPPQALVDLLKQPFCVGVARRAVLDQLERRYGRPFADQWDFARFALERKLGLDLTSPPKRPAPPGGERT